MLQDGVSLLLYIIPTCLRMYIFNYFVLWFWFCIPHIFDWKYWIRSNFEFFDQTNLVPKHRCISIFKYFQLENSTAYHILMPYKNSNQSFRFNKNIIQILLHTNNLCTKHNHYFTQTWDRHLKLYLDSILNFNPFKFYFNTFDSVLIVLSPFWLNFFDCF